MTELQLELVRSGQARAGAWPARAVEPADPARVRARRRVAGAIGATASGLAVVAASMLAVLLHLPLHLP